jgi:DNA polymerase sigma
MYLKRNKELDVLLLFLGDYRREYYLREISEKAHVPLKTTQTILSALEREKILKAKQYGKNKYFSLNLENVETKYHLEHAELYKTHLFLQKYPLFKTFLKNLKTQSIIILFGSFAKGTATKESDCDLLTISDKKEELPSHLLPYKIHNIQMTTESYTKAQNETLIKEVEEHHVIFNNHSLYINMRWWKCG